MGVGFTDVLIQPVTATWAIICLHTGQVVNIIVRFCVKRCGVQCEIAALQAQTKFVVDRRLRVQVHIRIDESRAGVGPCGQLGERGVDITLGYIGPQVNVITHSPYKPHCTDQLIVTVQVSGAETLAIGIVQLAIDVVLAQTSGH